MIKNILFDCADTLFRFHAKDDLAQRLSSSERAEVIHNAFFKSDIWAQYDNGLVSEDEVKASVLPLLKEEDRTIAETYFNTFVEHLTPFDGMEALLEKLKEKGYSLYLVSDFPHEFTYLWENFSLFRLFDGRAVSFEAKGSKKDLRLFDYLLKTYGLDPSECLFIDDVARLVSHAEKYGICGHVFCGVEDLYSYLREKSVL